MSTATGTNDNELSLPEQIYALKTWRYLRLAMAGLAIALVAGIGEDLVRGHATQDGTIAHCLQGSISAYYYTPLHGFMVGSLVAIGVCLYCLRGDTPPEDALLNLAGMFAPVVALVPTDPPSDCVSSAVMLDRFALAASSIFALAFLETVAFVVLFILTRGTAGTRPRAEAPTRADVLGYKLAVGVLAVEWALWVISFWYHVFNKYVHYSSASLMFVCLFLVVCARAAAVSPGHHFRWHIRHPNSEAKIAMLMAASVVVFLYLAIGTSWRYSVLQVELCLIASFMLYWLVQTQKGWHPKVGEIDQLPKIFKHLSEPSP